MSGMNPLQGAKAVQTGPNQAIIPLQYPQSVAVYDSYEDAQKAVDFLSDNKFPVENLSIVGTDLRSVERVTGRRGWPQALTGGLISGIGTGVFIGLLFWVLVPGIGFPAALLLGVVVSVFFGLMSAALAQAALHGRRDFASMTAIVATRYEVLGEHTVVSKAKQMLRTMPGGAKGEFGPDATPVGYGPGETPVLRRGYQGDQAVPGSYSTSPYGAPHFTPGEDDVHPGRRAQDEE